MQLLSHNEHQESAVTAVSKTQFKQFIITTTVRFRAINSDESLAIGRRVSQLIKLGDMPFKVLGPDLLSLLMAVIQM